jgi:hypothetical protein
MRAVQGSIGIRNNGRIMGNPILLPPGKGTWQPPAVVQAP